MTEAFVEFAERFDPEELTASFDRSIGRKPLFKFMSERKYWSLYRDLYPILTEKGGGRFPQMFAEEFVKAYEQLIVESLRANRGNEPLPKVELEPLDEKKYKEAMEVLKETGSTEPLDQLTGKHEKPAGAVLDDIEDLGSLNELIDFDDLESVENGDTVLDLMHEDEDEDDASGSGQSLSAAPRLCGSADCRSGYRPRTGQRASTCHQAPNSHRPLPCAGSGA